MVIETPFPKSETQKILNPKGVTFLNPKTFYSGFKAQDLEPKGKQDQS